jgi:hypothetical protein
VVQSDDATEPYEDPADALAVELCRHVAEHLRRHALTQTQAPRARAMGDTVILTANDSNDGKIRI